MVFHSRDSRRWGGLAAVLLATAAVVLHPTAARAESGPEIRIVKPMGSIRAGASFEAGVAVTWKGDSTRYVVTPGELDAPAWGSGGWDRVEARTTAEGTELTFWAKFSAKQPGTVSVPELRLVYVDPTEKPVAPPAAPPVDPNAATDPNAPVAAPPAPEPVLHSLKAEAFQVQVKADRRWVYPYVLAGVLLVALGLGGGFAWRRWRKSKEAEQLEVLAPFETADAALHAAKRHRLDGEFYTFYRELQRLVQIVGGEVKSEFGAKLDKRVEEVGFQNQQPTEDEIEGILKDLERALARWKEGKAS